jgi:hypothetical protein
MQRLIAGAAALPASLMTPQVQQHKHQHGGGKKTTTTNMKKRRAPASGFSSAQSPKMRQKTHPLADLGCFDTNCEF